MVDVLYIAGAGRSGSTILGSVIGEYPGFFHAGELRYIWEKSLTENRLCGCGREFAACDFWTDVFATGFGGRSGIDTKAMRLGDKSVSRVRQRPAAAMFAAPPMEAGLFSAYAHHLTRLYAAIQKRCDGRVVVDSSKSPYYLFALRLLPGLRLHVLHLVRDPRAVAFSRTRNKRHPEAIGSIAMRSSDAPRSARKWVETNRAAHLLGTGMGAAYRVLKYEDFIAAPARTIEEIHALMGFPVPADRFGGGTTIALGENHTVWGNPGRFRHGPVQLRLDEEWRTRMSRLKRAWVTIRTHKWRRVLGY